MSSLAVLSQKEARRHITYTVGKQPRMYCHFVRSRSPASSQAYNLFKVSATNISRSFLQTNFQAFLDNFFLIYLKT
nr:MAG TPA: hypothetical protein [Caudoviricetes sp.]